MIMVTKTDNEYSKIFVDERRLMSSLKPPIDQRNQNGYVLESVEGYKEMEDSSNNPRKILPGAYTQDEVGSSNEKYQKVESGYENPDLPPQFSVADSSRELYESLSSNSKSSTI